MPLKRCGSVSERLTVWFSRRSAARERRGVGVERLEAAGVERVERLLAAHEVERRALFGRGLGEDEGPVGKSNAARPSLPGGFAPRGFQRRRPAIIRWRTRWRSPSRAKTMRLPMRRTASTRLPSAARSGGSNVRTRNGLDDAHVLERLADDAAAQVLDVELDVRQLGHEGKG